MYAEYLEAASGIRYAYVHLAVKASEPTEGTVYAVGSVGGGHDDDVRTLLETVHQSQKLRHDTSLHLSVSLCVCVCVCVCVCMCVSVCECE